LRIVDSPNLDEAGWEGPLNYVVIIERGPTSYGAYVPDLPGCVAAAETLAEVQRLIREAIEFHIDGLRESGDPIPPASSMAAYVEVPAS
jgi:predicted RNase H-like HicB family nuclease